VTDTPDRYVFELVRQHDDYIEFSVSYYFEYNLWTAAGIGWISHNAPAYYLSSLKLNKWPAAAHYNKQANLGFQNLSLKFHNELLEQLTISHIRNHFSGAPPRVHLGTR
jgi:hypothetical protein